MLEFLINSQDEDLAEKYGLRGGVGIAAPQLAVTKRFLAIHVHDEKDRLYSYVLYNPKIRSHSVQQACLSKRYRTRYEVNSSFYYRTCNA